MVVCIIMKKLMKKFINIFRENDIYIYFLHTSKCPEQVKYLLNESQCEDTYLLTCAPDEGSNQLADLSEYSLKNSEVPKIPDENIISYISKAISLSDNLS